MPLARAYSHVVIEVADAARAEAFYRDVLGVAAPARAWDEDGARALALPSGAFIVLAERENPRTFPETGVHQAYRASRAAIASIVRKVAAAGGTVADYHEDRREEAGDNAYFADPDGNRIQLVAGAGPEAGINDIDHAVVQVSDIEWVDDLYVEALHLKAVHRTGWNTADFVRARAWGEGKENMAPGTRRWDQRYRDIPGGKPGQGRKVARPNPQLFLDMGGDDARGPVLGIFLAQGHFQESNLETTRGTPRVAFLADDGALDGIAAALAGAGARVEGPVNHPAGLPRARSVYARDPGGVLVEFCSLEQGRFRLTQSEP